MTPTGTRLTRVVAARDPGHSRFIRAAAITAGVLGSVVAGWGIVHLLHAEAGLLAASVFLSLQAGNLAKDRTPLRRLATTAMLLPTVIAAIVFAHLASAARPLAIVGFILLTGAAIWVRRFGPRASALGAIGFIGYFFTLFMRPHGAEFWAFLLIVAFAVLPQVMVRSLLLIRRPRRELRVLLDELRASSAAVLQAAYSADDPAQIRLLLARGDEIGRAIAQWQDEHDTASYIDCTPDLLEMRVLDARVDTEAAAVELVHVPAPRHVPRAGGTGIPDAEIPEVDISEAIAQALAVLSGISSSDAPSSRIEAAQAWATGIVDTAESRQDRPGDDDAAGLLIARATLAHIRLRKIPFVRGRAHTAPPPPLGGARAVPAASADSGLSGPSAGWRAWRDWQPSTRMAVQAMIAASLASGVGEAISASRWYWAVMTAFVIFTGASSRGSILTRAFHRVVGTIGGAAIGSIAVIASGGSPPALAVIALLAVFGMLYFGPLNYLYAAIFVTAMLVAIYRMLGILDPALLELRVGETLAGAAIGVLCAYLILSSSSRRTLTGPVDAYFDTLLALLRAVPAALASGDATGLGSALKTLEDRQAAVDQSIAAISTALMLQRSQRESEAVHLMYITTRAAARLVQSVPSVSRDDTRSDAGGFVTVIDSAIAAAEDARASVLDRTPPESSAREPADPGPTRSAPVPLWAVRLSPGSAQEAMAKALESMRWALRKIEITFRR